MNKVTIEKYVADDGTEFDNEKDCVKYEGTDYTQYMLNGIEYSFVPAQRWFDNANECITFLLIKVANEEQANRISEWASNSSLQIPRQIVAKDIIGHTIMFDVEVGWHTDETSRLGDIISVYDYFGTEAEYIGSLARAVMSGIANEEYIKD